MTDINFMLQDILSTLLGFLLFPLVLIVPGYITGWWLDLFDFRRRSIYSRLAISLLLSFAVSPILFYLSSSLFSFSVSVFLVILLLVACVAITFLEKPVFSSMKNKGLRWMIVYATVWFVFALFSLVDIQLGKELYYSVAGFDHATRISIVDAMARTGVPPVNPSYYPGHPVALRFLYFFWYILAALVDYIGGNVVDARGAFFASAIWCGLGLMAAVSFYLRVRNAGKKIDSWTLALSGIGLLTVSGLDIFPAILAMSNLRAPIPDMEHWNEQIASWGGSLLWVPHHVAAVIAGLVGVMLGAAIQGQDRKRQIVLMTVAGAAFASAFGLSIWVTFVFVLFWGGWLLLHHFDREQKHLVLPILFAGVFAVVLDSVFLSGLISELGTSTSTGSDAPLVFEIRTFIFVDIVAGEASKIVQTFLRLLLLPVNYFLEFGFYFIVAIIWFRQRRNVLLEKPYLVEILLLASAFFVGTFMRSTLIDNNDLGWRSWLPGQFILLVWGADVLASFKPGHEYVISQRTQVNLIFLATFGVLSTLLGIGLLRAEPYLAGSEFGERNYSARQAYTTIIQTLPESVVVQYNPVSYVNRPAGLYGMRQSAISDRTAYGMSQEMYLEKVSDVSKIFNVSNISDWRPIDDLCRQHFIDILVLEDDDPLWSALEILETERSPYYQNEHFAVFACGEFAAPPSP